MEPVLTSDDEDKDSRPFRESNRARPVRIKSLYWLNCPMSLICCQLVPTFLCKGSHICFVFRSSRLRISVPKYEVWL